MDKIISLTGHTLTIEQITTLVDDGEAKVVFEDNVYPQVTQARTFLDEHAKSIVTYGVNTGFGPMASYLIGKEQLMDLQRNLIYSHAVGMGNPIPQRYVLAAMLVRLNTLCIGRSGVSVDLIEQLRSAINNRIVPIVPEHGAVGTSGDLVQLAHIALGLLGEGQVWFQGKQIAAREAWDRVGIPPYELKPKEGLSLINGTSFMGGIAALMCYEMDRLLSLTTRTGAWALELVNGFTDGISERFHDFRPHQGQIVVAQALRELTGHSQMIRERTTLYKHHITNETHRIEEDVQEIYSLRCIPQIVGPMVDCLLQARRVVETEINAVTDNPIVDAEYEQFWHGGHFHGEYIAMVADQLRACVAKLQLLTDRRISFFLDEKRNRRWAPFLNLKTPGLTLALQGLQFVATSTAAYAQTLAYPHRVHSISTNGNNQDIVSMGTDSTLLTMKVIDDAYNVLAIELIALAQAMDSMVDVHDQFSPAARHLYAAIREQMDSIIEDRVLVDDLPQVVTLARTGRDILVNWHV